ncbi:MAG: DUF2797 domain-containing protein [Eggerthellaceae bacterium]|nr:DUF2797 domain-containing protein [Eggerthellaceae bacterium]
MSRIAPEKTLILNTYGYDAHGPHLVVNDVDGRQIYRLPLLGRTFSLVKKQRRFCIGSFDLQTFTPSACEFGEEFTDGSSFTDCIVCRQKTGFNPSFYNSNEISPQQRAYNATPHFVYMAYFSPQHVKVGISAEARGIERLLEQGARIAAILQRFPHADAARELEAHLCSQDGILESLQSSFKTKKLSDHFDPARAKAVLEERLKTLNINPVGGIVDFTPYYFGTNNAVPDIQQLTDEGSSSIYAGTCIGMVGDTLILKQEDTMFAAPLKKWKGSEIEIFINEVLFEYTRQIQQIALF